MEPGVADADRAKAQRLEQEITLAKNAERQGGTVVDWANESNAVARRPIYGEWPQGPGALPSDYAMKALPVVDEQLEKAGVRLAAVLNAALR